MKKNTFSHAFKLALFFAGCISTSVVTATKSEKVEPGPGLTPFLGVFYSHADRAHCDVTNVHSAKQLGKLPDACYHLAILATLRGVSATNLPTLSVRAIALYADLKASRFLFSADRSTHTIQEIRKNPQVGWSLSQGAHTVNLYGAASVKNCSENRCFVVFSPSTLVIEQSDLKKHTARYKKYSLLNDVWTFTKQSPTYHW